MQSEFIIRKIKPEEVVLLEDIIVDSLSVRDYSSNELKRMINRLEISNKLMQKSVIYVAELKNKIIGFWLREIQEDLSEGRFFVLKNYMKKGVGTALWKKMVHELKESHKLEYFTFISDEAARSFYEKMGATKIDEKPSVVLLGTNVPIMRYNLK